MLKWMNETWFETPKYKQNPILARFYPYTSYQGSPRMLKGLNKFFQNSNCSHDRAGSPDSRHGREHFDKDKIWKGTH